jgi:hypothetical protein
MDQVSPVFLIAPVRSGSTMLWLMLNHHPNINCPGECDFLFEEISDDGRLPSPLAYALALKNNRIYEAKGLILDTALTYPEIMRSFISQLSKPDSILLMSIHDNFHRIPHVFPDARYIRLLRDPRDVARSCIGMGWVGHVYFGVDIWKHAETSWLQLKSGLKQHQYIEIKYEDLLEDVELGLTQLCEFLGFSYSQDMLDYSKTSSYGIPDSSLCYQWKRTYSQHDLQIVEGKVGQEIVHKGYDLSGYDPLIPGPIHFQATRVRLVE